MTFALTSSVWLSAVRFYDLFEVIGRAEELAVAGIILAQGRNQRPDCTLTTSQASLDPAWLRSQPSRLLHGRQNIVRA